MRKAAFQWQRKADIQVVVAGLPKGLSNLRTRLVGASRIRIGTDRADAEQVFSRRDANSTAPRIVARETVWNLNVGSR